ncbi:predicted glutamine amidotransferase [Aquitalea magnusonii]|uniref:Predicted glutamine amidotransferase n=1 Tax=Aquitalea magnusonii TaxID=332411 RepID=A0A3G9G9Z1_9NEIS|nr:gamma-glutamyl-gamma-aminobutyrate hydrolase family protein [Aquitalea magnusonii]BBF84740.1 predicted glutamine amidotransferase [Aquitalea magnusonii]
MKPPLIGLTTYPAGQGHGYHTPLDYVHAVVRAGGAPVLLPPVGQSAIDSWLAALDGVVLIGGGDIAPALFDGGLHPTIYNLSPERDETEIALARSLLACKLPTLAICRGLQIINTVLGGSLHLHLPDVVGEAVEHRVPPRDPTLHRVRVAANSCLAGLLGSTQISSKSWHHQAIDRAGHGVRAVAWAEDGVIEAIEIDDAPQVIAVQWHPELSAAEDSRQQALFDALIRMSSNKN